MHYVFLRILNGVPESEVKNVILYIRSIMKIAMTNTICMTVLEKPLIVLSVSLFALTYHFG